MFKKLFIEELNVINEAHTNAVGTGLYMGLYLLALLYIYTKYKEEKNTRNFLLIYPIIVFIIIWNPIFAKILLKFIGNDVYWRVYWLLPIGITISYVFTKWIFENNNKINKITALLFSIFIIILSGKIIYTSNNFSLANNYFKIPNEILDLIFTISEDDEEYKKLAGPLEFNVYTRQVDGTILLEDGRPISGIYPDDTTAYYIENGLITEVASRAKEHNCNYVILKNETVKDGDLENFGFNLIKQNGRFSLYKFE